MWNTTLRLSRYTVVTPSKIEVEFILTNILQLITSDVATLFENVKHDAEQSKPKIHPTVSDMDKVQSTLKQIIRDWSKDGEEERAACYGKYEVFQCFNGLLKF